MSRSKDWASYSKRSTIRDSICKCVTLNSWLKAKEQQGSIIDVLFWFPRCLSIDWSQRMKSISFQLLISQYLTDISFTPSVTCKWTIISATSILLCPTLLVEVSTGLGTTLTCLQACESSPKLFSLGPNIFFVIIELAIVTIVDVKVYAMNATFPSCRFNYFTEESQWLIVYRSSMVNYRSCSIWWWCWRHSDTHSFVEWLT